jgi:hypothetical protein
MDGLVVNVISRDLPEHCDPTAPCEVAWNQDYVWYSKPEARRWLSDDPRLGDVHSVPDELVARLARFHLVDNVKDFRPDEWNRRRRLVAIRQRRGDSLARPRHLRPGPGSVCRIRDGGLGPALGLYAVQ